MTTTATLTHNLEGTVWDSPDHWTKTVIVPAGTTGQLGAVPNNHGIARLTVQLEDGMTAEIIVRPGDVEPASSSTPTGVPVKFCYTCGHSHPVTRSHCNRCGRASLFINGAGTCLTCNEATK